MRQRDAQAAVGPCFGHLHANGHQLGQRFGHGFHVLGFVGRQLHPGAALDTVRCQSIERGHGIDQVAGQCGVELAQIAITQVFAHFVVHIAQRIGAGCAVCPAGERTAQDDLGLVALAPADHQLKGFGVTRGGVLEVDKHAVRDDARRVVANAHEGTQQRGFFLF